MITTEIQLASAVRQRLTAYAAAVSAARVLDPPPLFVMHFRRAQAAGAFGSSISLLMNLCPALKVFAARGPAAAAAALEQLRQAYAELLAAVDDHTLGRIFGSRASAQVDPFHEQP